MNTVKNSHVVFQKRPIVSCPSFFYASVDRKYVLHMHGCISEPYCPFSILFPERSQFQITLLECSSG